MLIINKTQVQIFRRESLEEFKQKMKRHLRAHLGAYCSTLDDATLLNLIDSGYRQAAIYGITSEKHVCLYIDLMVIAGTDHSIIPLSSADILKNIASSNFEGTLRPLLNDAILQRSITAKEK